LTKCFSSDLPKALWLIQPKLLAQTNIWELVQTNLNHNPSAEKISSICLYAALWPHPGGTFEELPAIKGNPHNTFFFVNNAIEAAFNVGTWSRNIIASFLTFQLFPFHNTVIHLGNSTREVPFVQQFIYLTARYPDSAIKFGYSILPEKLKTHDWISGQT
jgi:hypothetical protein